MKALISMIKGAIKTLYQWWLQNEITKIERKLEKKLAQKAKQHDWDED